MQHGIKIADSQMPLCLVLNPEDAKSRGDGRGGQRVRLACRFQLSLEGQGGGSLKKLLLEKRTNTIEDANAEDKRMLKLRWRALLQGI